MHTGLRVATQLDNRFDGDTVSFNAVYSKEANAEAERYYKTRTAYMRAGGGLAFSTNIPTVALALRFMTGPAQS